MKGISYKILGISILVVMVMVVGSNCNDDPVTASFQSSDCASCHYEGGELFNAVQNAKVGVENSVHMNGYRFLFSMMTEVEPWLP